MEVVSGQVAKTPQEAQLLQQQDFLRCRNPRCEYWISPDEYHDTENEGHYFSCPNCKMTYSLVDPTPFYNLQKGAQAYGDAGPSFAQDIGRDYETKVGLSMTHQGNIGEEIIKTHPDLPGYGKITWWSTQYNDPIDGGVGDWGIEVKTLCIDVKNHYFVPGSPKRKGDMVQRAKELGFSGILGILVLLNYRTSTAQVYAREMPLGKWTNQQGRTKEGPARWHKDFGQKLLEEFPFKNPFLDPNSAEPQGYDVQPDDGIPF